jgi:hypothetical protein
VGRDSSTQCSGNERWVRLTTIAQRQQEERKDPASRKIGSTQRANQSKGFRPVPPRWDVTRPLNAEGISAGYYNPHEQVRKGANKGRESTVRPTKVRRDAFTQSLVGALGVCCAEQEKLRYKKERVRHRNGTRSKEGHEGRAYRAWRFRHASTATSVQNRAAESPSPQDEEDLLWRSRRTARAKGETTPPGSEHRTWIRASKKGSCRRWASHSRSAAMPTAVACSCTSSMAVRSRSGSRDKLPNLKPKPS